MAVVRFAADNEALPLFLPEILVILILVLIHPHVGIHSF